MKNKDNCSILILIMLILTTVNVQSQQRSNLRRQIEKIIKFDTEISPQKTPVILMGLQIADSSYFFTFQNKAITDASLEDQQAIAPIGGFSKVFTTLLTSILVEEDLFQWDDPINAFLSPYHQNPAMQEATLLDLVSHRSGLPKLPNNLAVTKSNAEHPFRDYNSEQLLNFYHSLTKEELKEGYHYSETGFALLQCIIEKQTGQSYDNLLNEKVLAPLDMTSTFTNLTNNEQTILPGNSFSGLPVTPERNLVFTGANGLSSTVEDLISFLSFFISGSSASLKADFEELRQRIAPTGKVKNTFIGMGWHIYGQKNYFDIIAHPGYTKGYRIFAGFVKETQTSVVIIANSPHLLDGLGYKVLKLINNNWKR